MASNPQIHEQTFYEPKRSKVRKKDCARPTEYRLLREFLRLVAGARIF